MQVRILEEFVSRHRGFDGRKTYEVQAFDRGDDSGAWVLLINENSELKWLEASHTRVTQNTDVGQLVGAG